MKKYELTSEVKSFMGHTLYRIKAVTAFGCIEAGEMGGGLRVRKTCLKMATHGFPATHGFTAMHGFPVAHGFSVTHGFPVAHGFTAMHWFPVTHRFRLHPIISTSTCAGDLLHIIARRVEQ